MAQQEIEQMFLQMLSASLDPDKRYCIIANIRLAHSYISLMFILSLHIQFDQQDQVIVDEGNGPPVCFDKP